MPRVRGYDSSTYGRAFADVYDDWYGSITDVDETVDFLASLVDDGRPDRAGHPATVVELGVGTGRLAVPLAVYGAATDPGFVVWGIDSSTEMLEVLRTRDHGRLVRIVVGDMVAALTATTFTSDAAPDDESRRAADDSGVDVVFVAYNTLFNVRSADGQRRCFEHVARVLRPGGRFVVEAFVPDVDAAGDHVGVRTMSTDRVVLSASRQRDDQHSEGHFIELTEAGGVRLRPWAIRWSTVAQLDEMAAGGGLELEHRFADFGRNEFDDAADRHVSVYRRPTT